MPVVAPAKATGLVPVDDAVRTQLQTKVADFVDDLVAQDVNSPEFGKRVDAISAMGQKEIRAAADQSNRFLDRPVKAMDGEGGVGADLTELRRTIEKLDPSVNGNLRVSLCPMRPLPAHVRGGWERRASRNFAIRSRLCSRARTSAAST